MGAGNSNEKDNEVSEKDFDVVAAIDFGTSYSGYGYSYKDTKEMVYLNGNFSRDSFISKFPTAILFDDKENFVAFGDDAVDLYSKYAESEKEHKYMFFDQFKMTLYKKQVNIVYLLSYILLIN